MRRGQIVLAALLTVLRPLPLHAQSPAELLREAEIKREVPYSVMRAKVPSMTLGDYNEAVRAVANQELGIEAPAPVAPPAAVPYRASGSTTTTRIGATAFSYGDNGVTGTSERIGNTAFYNDTSGATGTSTQIEPFTFHTVTKPTPVGVETTTGTSTTIGTTAFHSLRNGVTGTSTQIGNITFHTFSNGTSCTSTTIGTQTFTNCQK